MLRFVSIFALAAVASAQTQFAADPSAAKILKEQRFNVGDGRAGAAFATEDGQIFKEESDAAGNRIGQYSYIGDDGKTYTVRYSAGKDGFRILDGAHIPSGGQEAAAFDPNFAAAEEEEFVAPVEQRAVLPPRPQAARPVQQQQQQQFRPQPVVQQQQQRRPQLLSAEPPRAPAAAQAPNYNPCINPHDPTHRNLQHNRNAVRFIPNSPLAQQLAAVPNCAGCEGLNPFVNPFDETHQAGLLAGHQAGFQAPTAAPRAPAPRLPAAPRPAPRVQAQQQQVLLPTEAPRRNFFPPGQLSLNRHETGFEFNFES